MIRRHRRTWQTASLLYARSLDLAVLTLIGKQLTRCTAPLVYEILDIHPALTRQGLRSRLLRWLERRVLRRCRLLVVSSPAFIENYFRPRQRFSGQSFLLENKWPQAQMARLPTKLPCELDDLGPRWTIGWFGNIRCPESLHILTEVADRLSDRVTIYLRGCVTLIGKETLMNAIRHRQNMIFEGEYLAPDDLPDIYSRVHFNWCIDLCDGDNSRWLLPNRLYEGGYFGIPALAVSDHETGRVVRQRHLGVSLDNPLTESLCDMLLKMSCDQYVQMRYGIESLPKSQFVDTGDMVRLVAMAVPTA